MTSAYQTALEKNKKRKSLLHIEEAILELSEISKEFIKTGDLLINESEHIHYIVVSKVNPDFSYESNNVILLLHGFSGCGAMNYRLISALADNFHVISIDLPGFGFSARPKNPFYSIESCIDFFVERIKIFIDKLDLPLFSLIGHSLGAFIATHFLVGTIKG